MALRHLSRLGRLHSVHGTGITIENHRDKGGIDFLATVFSMEELHLGGRFLLEAPEQWRFFMSLIIMSASRRREPGQIDAQALLNIFQQQRILLQTAGDSRAAVIELELPLHDQLNSQIDNINASDQ